MGYTGRDLEALVRDNIGWMLVVAERLVRDRALAEDVVQEAFTDALRGLEDFQGRSSLETRLRRITINAALMALRRRKRLAEESIDDLLPDFDEYGCRVETPWTHTVPLEDLLHGESVRAQVTRSINALPDAYRVVLQLRDIEGYDTAEVAALLDISTSNVKVRLHRARAALKKMLEPLLRGEVPEE